MPAEPTMASLMAAVDAGDSSATAALFTSLYTELHRLARHELYRNGAPLSLGATTLLHEAYMDMSRREGRRFPDRARFMATRPASRAG